jgi:hypothetical protein
VSVEKWFHQTQPTASGSWYNNEVQHYTDRKLNCWFGHTKDCSKKRKLYKPGVNKQFTSARLNSKFAFRYGRVDDAKVPVIKEHTCNMVVG